LAETKWDNVGVLIEAPFPRINPSKVVLTIDLTSEVLNKCVLDKSVGVIVAYHPPLFKSFKRLTMQDEKQKIALICASSGISVYSPHTSLDNVRDGINDWLAKGLGKGTVTVINPINTNGEGSGRIICLNTPVSIEELVRRVKCHLKLKYSTLIFKEPYINSTARNRKY